MKKARKRYGADFKVKVALEAIRGELTLAELVAKHGVPHMMIGGWKRQAMGGIASLFGGGKQATKAEAEVAAPRQIPCAAAGAADVQAADDGGWLRSPFPDCAVFSR